MSSSPSEAPSSWEDGIAAAETLVVRLHKRLNAIWDLQSVIGSDPKEIPFLEFRAVGQAITALHAIAMLRAAGCPWSELDGLWWTAVRYFRKSLEASAEASSTERWRRLHAFIDSSYDSGTHLPPGDMFRYFSVEARTLPSGDILRILDDAFQDDLEDAFRNALGAGSGTPPPL